MELLPSALEIRDAIGELADGLPVDPELIPFIRAAVMGLCSTSDGEQQFVVDVHGCALIQVDTEELVWPRAPGADIDDDVPLAILTDRQLWQEAHRRWDEECPREWSAFLWRIAEPLHRRLGFAAAWR